MGKVLVVGYWLDLGSCFGKSPQSVSQSYACEQSPHNTNDSEVTNIESTYAYKQLCKRDKVTWQNLVVLAHTNDTEVTQMSKYTMLLVSNIQRVAQVRNILLLSI